MYLMRQIGRDGQYKADLPDFMVFLDWKSFPWHWWNTDHFGYTLLLVVAVPGLLSYLKTGRETAAIAGITEGFGG